MSDISKQQYPTAAPAPAASETVLASTAAAIPAAAPDHAAASAPSEPASQPQVSQETQATQQPPASQETQAPASSDQLQASQASQDAPQGDAKEAGDARGAEDGHSHKLPGHIKARIATGKEKVSDKKDHIRDKTSSSPPGGYDDTPLPPAHNPTYTVKFTFHRAKGLPVADLGNTSSDPFIHATLTVPGVGTRHEEDPTMVHRTQTKHKTTEPEWEEEWVVAGIPEGPFTLKCRLYDEDATDHDDRLGNVTVEVPFSKGWKGIDHQTFDVKKRMGSKRAYLLKAAAAAFTDTKFTPTLELSVQVVDGPTDQKDGARLYTAGPTRYVRHFSPMIGRITNTRVNRNEAHDEANTKAAAERSSGEEGKEGKEEDEDENKTKKYDFQACEIQLHGPVPAKLYHRYVEFRPFVGRMFSSKGIRGHILNKALHKQHNRVYNYSRTTETEAFKPCSEEAALAFLKLAHFDEGGRIFTYMISLDGIFRFTETGKEFGIDLLSKHTMHSNVATYIAFSGEFFIRRLAKRAGESSNTEPGNPAAYPSNSLPPGSDGPDRESSTAADEPGYYQLIIDNDSGTYRPDKSLLPILQKWLEENFPGLGVVAMHWEDETLQNMKKEQHESKKKAGGGVHMVMNRNGSNSSLSSSDESRLSDMDAADHGGQVHAQHKSKKEVAWELLEDPTRIKDLRSAMQSHTINGGGK
ncbi:hypothetical protein SBRCBS47491_000836 [Sporothrix bragantina]|uniref:C2 domain-containing protein n=1 Tax=Sporothrix bragantina TaxID=671064 RepID=A0ABP0ATN5_9PEZI